MLSNIATARKLKEKNSYSIEEQVNRLHFKDREARLNLSLSESKSSNRRRSRIAMMGDSANIKKSSGLPLIKARSNN